MSVSTRVDQFRRRLHPAAAPVLFGAAGLAGATLVHFVDPNQAGNYPTCPWLLLTGTYCPGCGTMRAVHALTNLDFAGAMSMNVLLLVMLPFLAYGYVHWLYRAFKPAPPPEKMTHPFWLWLLLAAILGYWVVRNLPFPITQWLAPG